MRRCIVGVLAVFALIAAACGDDAAPTTAPPVTDPPATTIAPTTTTTAAVTTTTTVAPTTTTTVPPTTTTMPVVAASGEILTAGPNGIALLGGPVLIPPVAPEPGQWTDAIPDGAGGLVYVGVGQDPGQIIWWWRAGAAEPTLVSFKPGRILHDAAVIDGRPTAVVVDNPDPSESAEPELFVQLIDLETGDTTTGRQVGGIEWGAAQVSYRDGAFLVTEVNHSCGALVVFDLGGADIALPGLPDPPCLVHFEVPYAGADFGPPGTGYAYVEYHTEDTGEAGGQVTGADLVVVGEDGAERARIPLGTGDGRLGEVDFDGERVLVAGPWPVGPGPPPGRALLVDVATGTVAEVDGGSASSVHFAGPVPLGVG